MVNSVEMNGSEKYLVMQEVEHNRVSEILLNQKKLDQCDLLCLVYDTSDANSFGYLASLRVRRETFHQKKKKY